MAKDETENFRFALYTFNLRKFNSSYLRSTSVVILELNFYKLSNRTVDYQFQQYRIFHLETLN